MKVAIYCRVSTDGQELEQQKQACIKFCEFKGWQDYEVIPEIQSAGKYRPIFRELLEKVKHGQYSHLMLFRIDRGWRSSREFIMDFDMLQARGVIIVSVMEGLDPTTPMGKAMLTVIVALAELERANISNATKDRLQALKRLGKTLGRPKGSKDRNSRKNLGYLIREAKKRGDRKTVENLTQLKNPK